MLMSAPMVRAILENRKTQTRRIMKPQIKPFATNGLSWDGHAPNSPYGAYATTSSERENLNIFVAPSNPYGKAGDRLWVRETHAFVGTVDPGWLLYRASGYEEECQRHRFDRPYPPESSVRWRPSIHMPRNASRIDLEISGVRVERLNEISEYDAEKEGSDPAFEDEFGNVWAQPQYKYGFRKLWESINGAGSWELNPWVWVVEFKRVK